MSKQQNKGQSEVTEQPTQTKTEAAPPVVETPAPEKHIAEPVGELIKAEEQQVPEVAIQRTFFKLDMFENQPVIKFDNTFGPVQADGTRKANGDKFSLMTRKQASEALGVKNIKENRTMLDKTIIDEGLIAWRKVKGFLMMLPDEWILRRFIMKQKKNGRTSLSLSIEDLEKVVVDLQKAAEAWDVPVEELAEFLAAKKAARAKKAQASEGKPATVVEVK